MPGYIQHFSGFTIHVNGSGILRPSLIGLDDVITATLAPYTMSDPAGKEPTRLANFKNQRARLKLETTGIDEIMKVDRIIIWIKPIATQFPG